MNSARWLNSWCSPILSRHEWSLIHVHSPPTNINKQPVNQATAFNSGSSGFWWRLGDLTFPNDLSGLWVTINCRAIYFTFMIYIYILHTFTILYSYMIRHTHIYTYSLYYMSHNIYFSYCISIYFNILYYIISYYIISYHIIVYYIVLLYYIIIYYIWYDLTIDASVRLSSTIDASAKQPTASSSATVPGPEKFAARFWSRKMRNFMHWTSPDIGELSWFIQKFLICWILNRPKWDLKQYQVTKLGVFLRNKPGGIWSGLGQSFPRFIHHDVMVPVTWTTQNSHYS